MTIGEGVIIEEDAKQILKEILLATTNDSEMCLRLEGGRWRPVAAAEPKKGEERKPMEYKIEKKKAPGREEVEVLGATFEEGKPQGEGLGR